MAVTSVNLARISFQQRMFNMQESMRFNQLGLYRVQNSLATGLRFLRPSEDPLRSSAALRLERQLDRLNTVSSNVKAVDRVLTEVESAASDAVTLATDAQTLVVQAVGDTITPEERQSLATVVSSMLDQLIRIGNRRSGNTYLFSGHQIVAPFSLGLDGVLYQGDGNRRLAIVESDLSSDAFTVPGMELFGAVSAEIRGTVDLNPALSAATRIADLGGTTGRGVQLGRIAVTAGGQRVEIDLSTAATAADVVDLLNSTLPGGLHAELNPTGFTLTQPTAGPAVVVEEVGGGTTARDLGLVGSFTTQTRGGGDVQPRLTTLTRVADLRSGAGLDLASGFVVRNGSRSATIDLNGAETVEDVIGRVNRSEVGAWARISEDGQRLELRSRVSGTNLTIEENGGLTATQLGIRSMQVGTRLADLNDGGGVPTVDGNDLRITTASGAQIDVDLTGALTLGDVIDRINAAGGANVTATFVAQGNGLLLIDNTAGGGTLLVEALNDSPSVQALGLDVAATGNQISGRDVRPVRADSVFTALLELREGLETSDRLKLMQAGQRLDRVLPRMQEVQGQMASQARMMGLRGDRVETETSAAQVLLSDVRDVDFTDAVLRFQQLQMALQANLQTASQVMRLSLLDYLPAT